MDGRPNEQVLTVAPLGGRDLARAGWLKGFALRYGRKVRAVKTAADLNPTTIPAAARALAADVLEGTDVPLSEAELMDLIRR